MKSRTKKEVVVKHFKERDLKLAELVEEINLDEWFEEKTLKPDEIFRTLCRTIVGQQLAGKAASAIFKRFSDYFEGVITPEQILKKTDADLRALGLSWAKARSVLDLALKTKEGDLQLEKMYELENEEVIAELVKVKGIGRWTAEMFLMFRLGREDIFSLGDLGLKNGLKKHVGKTEMSPDEILKVVEVWSPYKTYGAIAMWHLLDNR